MTERIGVQYSRNDGPRRIWLCRHCLVLLTLFIFEGNLFADGSVGIITKIRGQVTAQKTGEEKIATLRVGDRIAVGQIIRTAKGAAAQLVLTDDSVAIHVLPAATLQVSQYDYSAEDQRRSAVVKVTEGSARFVLYKQKNRESRFIVVTDQARLNVGIADFVVRISGKETEVANLGLPLSTENISQYTVGRVQVGTNQQCIVEEKSPPSWPSTITPEKRRKYLKDSEI
jgi:hypothetical protein